MTSFLQGRKRCSIFPSIHNMSVVAEIRKWKTSRQNQYKRAVCSKIFWRWYLVVVVADFVTCQILLSAPHHVTNTTIAHHRHTSDTIHRGIWNISKDPLDSYFVNLTRTKEDTSNIENEISTSTSNLCKQCCSICSTTSDNKVIIPWCLSYCQWVAVSYTHLTLPTKRIV